MRKETTHLTFDEIKELIKKTKKKHHQLILRLLWYTGCRASEVIRITPKMLIPPNTIKHPILKFQHEKIVEKRIPPQLMYELREYIIEKEIKQNEPIFNLSRRAIGYLVKNAGKRIGKPWLYPHAIRHSLATYLGDKIGTRELQEFFGWRSIGMAVVYSHLEQKKVAEKVGDILK